jgi:hypothetical protein
MPVRRRIIHDSSPSSSPPRGEDHQVPRYAVQRYSRDSATLSASACQAAEPAAKLHRPAEGHAVVVIEDDSESDSSQSELIDEAVNGLPAWNPLHFAAQFGYFPTADDVPMVGVPAASVAVDILSDDSYLWNAVPPPVCQYLDLEAACDDDTTSGSDGSDGELTPGFVDDIEPEKENITADDMELLHRLFPHTFKFVSVVLLVCMLLFNTSIDG